MKCNECSFGARPVDRPTAIIDHRRPPMQIELIGNYCRPVQFSSV